MDMNRCGHYSTEVEQIYVQHSAVVLRVPLRRCALAEKMLVMMSRSEDGREVAAKIQLVALSGSSDEDLRIRAAFGPDLEAINAAECTSERCRESCTPGYKLLLNHFGYAIEADQETGSDCFHISSKTADPAG